MTLDSLEREQLFSFLLYHSYLDEGHGCWLWKLGKSGGYGVWRFRGQNTHIHRVAYAVFNGDFDDQWHVLHRCDVRHCYYPGHLFLGTNADNVADMLAKGRQAKGENHGMFGRTGEKSPTFGRTGAKHPLFGKGHLQAGEKAPGAKLREYQVIEILAKCEAGLCRREIAKEYGVHHVTVNDIVNRKTWKHVKRD